MKLLLYPYSWVSRGVSRVRDRLYRAGLFASKRAGLKVVSVGNISLGGTGKTPLVLELIKRLQAEGHRVAMVTRGYKGRWEKKHGRMLTDGEKIFGTWRDGGDEPFMVARNSPGAGVFVGRDRLRSCRLAKVRGFSVAVLDDGFQRRRLDRDLDIVLFDPREKILREPVAAMGRAQIILLPEEQADPWREELARRFPRARVYLYGITPRHFVRLGGKHPPLSAAELKGVRFLAFSGIARPGRFYALLEQQGLEVAGRLSFPDHHPYPEGTLTRIHEKCVRTGAKALVTTEKDAVKLAGRTGFARHLPLYYLKIGLRVEEGFFDQVLKAVPAKERHR
jgi:tetraacyldisaccharide 4'-kinase